MTGNLSNQIRDDEDTNMRSHMEKTPFGSHIIYDEGSKEIVGSGIIE